MCVVGVESGRGGWVKHRDLQVMGVEGKPSTRAST